MINEKYLSETNDKLIKLNQEEKDNNKDQKGAITKKDYILKSLSLFFSFFILLSAAFFVQEYHFSYIEKNNYIHELFNIILIGFTFILGISSLQNLSFNIDLNKNYTKIKNNHESNYLLLLVEDIFSNIFISMIISIILTPIILGFFYILFKVLELNYLDDILTINSLFIGVIGFLIVSFILKTIYNFNKKCIGDKRSLELQKVFKEKQRFKEIEIDKEKNKIKKELFMNINTLDKYFLIEAYFNDYNYKELSIYKVDLEKHILKKYNSKSIKALRIEQLEENISQNKIENY